MLECVARSLLGERFAPPPGAAVGPLPPDVTLRRGSLLPRIGGLLSRMGGPAAAVALRRTIVVHPDARLTPSLLAHELAHVKQWRDDPLFPFRYSVATLRHGYRGNPYEVEARAFAASASSNTNLDEAS